MKYYQRIMKAENYENTALERKRLLNQLKGTIKRYQRQIKAGEK